VDSRAYRIDRIDGVDLLNVDIEPPPDLNPVAWLDAHLGTGWRYPTHVEFDTIRLIVFPVVLGSGKRLFAEGRTSSSFRLTEVTSTPSGVTMQSLDLTGPPEYGEVEIE